MLQKQAAESWEILVLEAVCHLHFVAALTGRITSCIFMSCFIQGTWLHGAQGVKQGAVIFFFLNIILFFGYCKMCACFVCLLPAKQALQAIHHYSLSCGALKMFAATLAL